MSEPEGPNEQKPFELPLLNMRSFMRRLREILGNPNLGAGIVATGTSGSGKTNVSLWTIQECLDLGIPFIHIDPHGDAAKKAFRMCLARPKSQREKIIYWHVGDPHNVAALNPLAVRTDEEHLTEYERHSRGRILVELTASIVLAAVGEGGAGFGFRPVMRKWITGILWLLWHSGLTLADARLLLDPRSPIFEQLLKLAPDEMSRHAFEALLGMRPHELEGEIGSARNRLLTLLEHPVAEVLFSRRHDTIDFYRIYKEGYSIIVDLGRGEMMSEEVQRVVANVVLTTYLSVVMSMPEAERRRRQVIIDELPVFNETCAPLLEKMCTEIRKFKTSFLFLHQGGSRFEGRTENAFLQTIHDMCRTKLIFRHTIDAPFLGSQIALAAYDNGNRVKHVQKATQQFTEGQKIVELIDRGSGTSEMEGTTTTDGTTSVMTEALATAVRNADQQTRTATSGANDNHSMATQRTSTRTTNVTVKQTLSPIIVNREVVTGVQFYSKEEIEWAAASTLAQLQVGEAVLVMDGEGVWKCKTPLAEDPLQHAPVWAAGKLTEWRSEMLELPEFVSPEVIQKERSEFLKNLLRELRRMTDASRPGQLLLPDVDADNELLDEPPEFDDEDPDITL